ncbi:SusC/RagA family TonB-linked outer membrane protein [Pedobacter sp. MC2016-24]|uniref:SusC/RagA family TonB-linked outer membrane protein n=1 Tax=Pedobacter sp. MC2016-24 TaxID=2780090 RepID=UPI0018801D73|nr:SusC/RagA family TonB-linked outer membrane protein [Pedobacter sp. MC2016-24]MBE9600164.1 SusC/RagA family TonB-linked outer membrane protein [Pedobacter sp. MC2016-24]
MYKIFTQKICTPLGYMLNFLLFAITRLGHIEEAEKQKWLMRIKFTSFIFFITLLQVSAAGLAQKLTYKQQNVTLKQLFGEINKQTGYNVFWSPKLIRGSEKINADFKNTPIEEVLERSLNGLPLTFVIEDKTVVIKEKERSMLNGIFSLLANIDLRGKVVDESGKPLAGATVAVKGGKVATTDKDGNFYLSNIDEKAILYVSYIGYARREIGASENLGVIKLALSDSKLDEVQVMGYGETNRRTSTNNITKVSGEEIAKSPINNPIAALESRVPGMIVSQSSGVPGSAVKVEIRGRTKVDAQFGADESPLFIIDGVPMASGNNNLNLLSSAISANGTSGLSPFSTINAGDIESIEVLKDADATSIYGSRGASGVVLITTKKGKAGNTIIGAKVSSGISKARIPEILSVKEYVAMRKEAFKNDNKAMTVDNAYDLLLWDTTRTTNLAKELIGGTAHFTRADASISGGSNLIQFIVRGNYSNETNVYPKPMPNTTASGYVNVNGKTSNQKFSFNFTGTYTFSKNQTAGTDLAFKLNLPPNFRLYNDDGSLSWNEGGKKTDDNPLGYLLEQYTSKTSNVNGNLVLGYKISDDLAFKTSFGYNTIKGNELRNSPKAAKNPLETASNLTSMSSFGNNNFTSAIIEPQLEYKKDFGKGKLNVLIGGTYQTQSNDGYNFSVRDYSSDLLLGTLFGITGSNFINPNSFNSEYKYAAFFGRVSYNYDNKYIVNLSGRRDGSSRFGPNYKYSSFGAIGAAWVFSSEEFLQNDVLSFGKLRGSYGTAGNDKIGDYQFLALYGSSAFSPTYKDSLAISPLSLFKPDLHWEKSKKLEIAVELGFLKDRILLSAAWYRNNSSDPLVQYPLPPATGFGTVTANLSGVVVQNRGLELTLSSDIFKKPAFGWNTSFNLTVPQNKLLKYPGLAQSSYASKYIVGRSLDIVYLSNFLGVDPTTGLYKVEDLNNNGKYDVSNTGDLRPDFDTEPSFYGGLQNDFRYKNFGLSIFMSFMKQYTRNWYSALNLSRSVGDIGNVPSYVLDRWQYEGQVTNVQKYTTVAPSSSLLNGQYGATSSNALYDNIFWMRMKTVSLSYNLPQPLVKRLNMKAVSVYLQAQNLFTFSPFKSTDPESVFITRLAPLRTIVAGLQFNF